MFKRLILDSLYLIIPLIVLGLGYRDTLKSKRSAMLSVAVILLAEFTTTFFFKHILDTEWTSYEYFCIASIISCIYGFIFQTKQKIKSLSYSISFFILCISITFVLYSIITYGQTVIHSDTATATLLAQSQIEHRSLFPKTWCYVNGDIWTLSTNIFTMPFTALINNQSLARMLGSVAIVVFTCICLYFFSRKLLKNESYIITIPLFFLLTFVGFYSEGSYDSGFYDMTLYQAAYTGVIFMHALIAWSAYGILSSRGYKKMLPYAAFYAAVSIVLHTGGIRAVAEFSLPILATMAIYCLIKYTKEELMDKQTIRMYLTKFFLLAFPPVLGFSFYIGLCHSHIVVTQNNDTWMAENIETLWKNTVRVFLNTYECFGYKSYVKIGSFDGLRNLFSILLCFLFVFIIPILQAKCIRNESDETKFLFTYGILHNICLFATCVLLGKTTNRYYLSSVFIFDLISASYIINHWRDYKIHFKAIAVTLYSLIIIIYSVPFLSQSEDWNIVLREKKEFCQALVDHGLSKGYATFWNAYSNEVYSDLRLEFAAINYDQQYDKYYPMSLDGQCWWLVDSERFCPDYEAENTFLLLSEEQNDGAKKGDLQKAFGTPVEDFTVDDMYVYVYDYDIAEKMRNGLWDNILKPNELSCNENTEFEYDKFVIHKGGAVSGPGYAFDKGSYNVVIRGNNLEEMQYKIDAGIFSRFISYTEIERDSEHIQIKLEISQKSEAFEFIMHNNENLDIIWYEIGINRI